MTIDYETLRNWRLPPIEQTWTERDTMLYALGLGLGSDPLDAQQLRFVCEGLREGDLLALPTMAGVLGYPGFWLKDPALGIDWVKAVHGEQAMTLHKPLPVSGTIVGINRVLAVVDKGAGRGALVITERTLTDKRSGELLATLLHTAFCRGDGGFSANGKRADPAVSLPVGPPAPLTPPDAVLDCVTFPESALIYRLSGDDAALHADPALARAAGFPRPILHGMATFGIAGHAILKLCCGYDPSRLSRIAGRFSSVVFPGETIRTEVWFANRDALAGSVTFRARAVERDVVVLDHGHAETAALHS